MDFGPTIEFGLGQEERGLWAIGAVFRSGLPFRGNGGPIRDPGVLGAAMARLAVGKVIAVDWLPDVSWKPAIRCLTP